jgi:hypothetical protein
MIRIAHDFFHVWRQVVVVRLGDEMAGELELAFWERVGLNTAQAYLASKATVSRDVETIIQALAKSSRIMGEEVRVEREGKDWLLVHEACPWPASYKRFHGDENCRPGCDRWFKTTVAHLNSCLEVYTEASIPDGYGKCVRRFRLGQCAHL